jgi:hypothetical protein
MKRLLPCALCLALITACSFQKQSSTKEAAAPSPAAKQSPAAPATTQTQSANSGELQPGQASGTYTAKGEVVEVKYAYAGRAERFGTQSLVVLLTDKPIPPEALAEEIKSTPMLEGEKLRGLEYVLDENSMWVRYHPSQYQESSSNKLKDYKVENDIVRGVDEGSDLSNGRYTRSVRFVATIAK